MSEHKVNERSRIAELRAEVEQLKAKLAEAKQERELEQQVAELQKADLENADEPTYLLNEPVYIQDTWIGAGSEIKYRGEPNDAMVPLNQPAKDKWEDRFKRLEAEQRKMAEMHGVEFAGLITDRDDLMAQANRYARFAQARGMLPITKEPKIPTANRPNAPVHGGMESTLARKARQQELLVAIKEPAPMPRGPGLAGMAANSGIDFGIPVSGASGHQIHGG